VLVTTELSKLSGIKAPRSWPKDSHGAFFRLPLAIQRQIVKRENDRDRAIRHLQNADAAVAEIKRKANAA
jgi:hypothetical protein